MGFLDFFSKDKKGADAARERRSIRQLSEGATDLDTTINIIRKNPYMKYAFDNELLSALEKGQQQLLMNQQLILDSVTVKDPQRGEMGIAEYLISGSLLDQFKDISVAGKQHAHGGAGTKSLEALVEKLNRRIEGLEAELEKSAETSGAAAAGNEGDYRREAERLHRRIELLQNELQEKEGANKSFAAELDALRSAGGKGAVKAKQAAGRRGKAAAAAVPETRTALQEKFSVRETELLPERGKVVFGYGAAAEIGKAEEAPKGISKFVQGISSIIDARKLFQRKVKFHPFTHGNFYFEYPGWVPDLNVSEDVLLSVSSGACGVESSVKELYPLTFGGYVSKVVSLVKSQLKATILVEKTGVDSAYLEFVFMQGRLEWLYKAKIVECNSKFYTVAVKSLKEEVPKIKDISDHVLGSVRCMK
ncbi:MAG: hypothetical protein V1676_06485 [Candidatus Diapherotrites archaeon]